VKIPFTNIEIRSTKRPRPDEWDDFWFQRQTFDNATGIEVNEDNALTYFAVWACRKVISEDIGSLPLFIYRRVGKSKEKYQEHPLYYLLHNAPNDEMTAMNFRETMQNHVLGFGNAFAEIQRDLRGRPTALWPLNPGQMQVMRPARELVYEYRLTDTGEKRQFAKEDIFHLAGLGFNGIVGYTPLKYWAETIGLGIAEQRFQANNYKKGGRLQLVFVHPAPKAPSPEGRQQFREEIRKEYGGHEGSPIGVTWEGMKPEKVSMTMEDAQIIEAKKLSWLQICAIHRVPPHKVMNLFHATFSNIENQDIDYVKSTIRPWATRWEQTIDMRLLNGSGIFFAKHELEGMMRGDFVSQQNGFAMGRQWGWFSANDVRNFMDLNPVEGGDVYLSPMNMISVDQLGKIPEPNPEVPITDEEKEQAALAIRRLRIIRR